MADGRPPPPDPEPLSSELSPILRWVLDLVLGGLALCVIMVGIMIALACRAMNTD